jgi:hypothetical protein
MAGKYIVTALLLSAVILAEVESMKSKESHGNLLKIILEIRMEKVGGRISYVKEIL